MRERVLILRDQDLEHSEAGLRERMLRRVEVTSSPCGTATEQKRERIFTLNGAIRPRIPIDSGERQFWRIVNASPDLYADLQLSGGQFEIVALDGMPLSYHDPEQSTRRVDHLLVPPAGRVEAIIVGPPSGGRSYSQYTLR
jgi:suppressor of ftsI